MSTKKEPSALRKALGELAPKLVDLTRRRVVRRRLGATAALEARSQPHHLRGAHRDGKTEQRDFHFPNAIKNGVTQEELIEMITHLAFYGGWPNAMSAVNRAKALFAKKEGT